MDAEIQKLVDNYRAATSTKPQKTHAGLWAGRDQSSYHNRKLIMVDDLPVGAVPLDPEIQNVVYKVKSAPPDKTLTERIAPCFTLTSAGLSHPIPQKPQLQNQQSATNEILGQAKYAMTADEVAIYKVGDVDRPATAGMQEQLASVINAAYNRLNGK